METGVALHLTVHYANDKVPNLGDLVLHTAPSLVCTLGIVVGLNSAGAQVVPLARKHSPGAQFYPVWANHPEYVSLSECWLLDVSTKPGAKKR